MASNNLDFLIAQAAARHGLGPAEFKRVVQIESGGDPKQRTGSYSGLTQLSKEEFAKYGGKGDITDAAANLEAGAAKLAAETQQFTKQFGRPPTPNDLYMIHQQGWGGYQAHTANPDQPAWKSMASTAEGRQKGEGWSKLAISGNIPKQWGVDPETITSREFVERWGAHRRGAGSPPAAPDPAQAPPAPAPQMAAAPPPAAPEPPTGALAAIPEAEPTPGSDFLAEAMRIGGEAMMPRQSSPFEPTSIAPSARNLVAVLGSSPAGQRAPVRAPRKA